MSDDDLFSDEYDDDSLPGIEDFTEEDEEEELAGFLAGAYAADLFDVTDPDALGDLLGF